jgi:hypothetical protein
VTGDGIYSARQIQDMMRKVGRTDTIKVVATFVDDNNKELVTTDTFAFNKELVAATLTVCCEEIDAVTTNLATPKNNCDESKTVAGIKGYSVNFSESGRRGRVADVKPNVSSAPAAVQRAREASLGVKGSRIFNILPDSIRNTRGGSVDAFKFALDKFLATVPDQPTIPGLTRAAESNSLLHQVPMQAAQQS